MTENPLDNLIGLHCIVARWGFAGRLIIELNTEWRFETVMAAWRLVSSQGFQTGSSENPQRNDEGLQLLLGSRIARIQYNTKTDISIFFDNGCQVDTFLQGSEFPPFELHHRNQATNELIVIQRSIHGEWEEPEDHEFTDEDKLASEHSKQATKRWNEIVPAKSFDNHCRDCAYYLETSGRFYFWDFGICSNGKSVYDGSVVGIKSSCEHFSFDLLAEE